ncbi:EF-hand domain-containing protein [Bradyrhizobium lablabi]|uniref:EF-hand domain-containing protein n=1 Tax=Bradyrhizobium lablabi TaxID=722472 RepID=UPI001BA8BE1E|nr:EF-hand domain-containing protein [Bradyrhizobium lablabi]MBR0696410.1 EF-hand domain-containing protein [Bradyrhizobium lablabi]
MLFALGAASSAIDFLKSLTSPKSTSTQPAGPGQGGSSPFGISTEPSSPAGGGSAGAGSASGLAQIAPETFSALLDAQGQSPQGGSTGTTSRSDALKDLFSQIDGNGDGKITQSEFENTLGAGGTNIAQADDVFSKLDGNGDGSVNLDEMSQALQGGKGHHHHHHVASSSTDAAGSGSSDASSSDPLLQALDGASSTSVTNSDGSTTTTLTYADGSKVTTTTPAAQSASSNATSSYNFIEQLIQRQAHAVSAQASASVAISV